MKKLITTLAVTLVAATVTQADTIAAWDTDGLASTDVTVGAASSHADVSASLLERHVGANSGWGNSLTEVRGGLEWVTSLSFAIASDSYFSFTVTPDAGKSVNYDNVAVNYNLGLNGGVPGSFTFELLSSETGFTFEDGLATMLGAGVAGYEQGSGNLDISGVAELDDVSNAVEFRMYYYGTSGTPARIGLGYAFGGTDGADDLRVDGSVVPEPSTLALVGLASAGMLMFRKRFSI